MKNSYITLNCLQVGQICRVKEINSDGILRRRLLDLGLIQDTVVEALLQSPSGDPMAYLIRGAVIALRSEVAYTILVELI